MADIDTRSLPEERPSHLALAVSLIYFVTAAAWILLSDRLLESVATNPATLTSLQTFKGWFFVTVTAGLLFLVLNRDTRRRAREASERRRSEEKIRQLSQAVEQSPVSVVITDVAGKIEYVNRTFTELTGYSHAEVLGQNPRILKSGELPTAAYQAMWKCITTGGTWRGEFHNRKKNGESFWEAATISPILDANGTIAHFLAIKEDITERKRVLEALRTSEERLRVLIENAHDLITLVNDQGVIQFQSPSCQPLLGYTAEEMRDRNAFELVHPEDAPRVREALAKALSEAGRAVTAEFRFRHADGGWHTLEAIGKLLTRAATPTVMINSRDVTERRKLEEQFRQAQKMDAIGQLAGGVAHDFNNLLAVIQGRAGLLELSEGFSAEQRESTEEIQNAVERAANLTRQLLLFSRRQTLQLRQVDLSETVTSMTKMLRRIVGEDIRIRCEYAPQALLLNADPGMLDQILLNLAVNARDAMPKGGDLTISTAPAEFAAAASSSLAPARAGSFACLTVTDTGCGIPPEIQPRIFEPFFTTKEVGKGTGLGLATVYGIVQQHHGWITVESEVGKGTSLRIYFPRMISPQADATENDPMLALRGGNETVLLVEDDSALRLLVARLLARFGYRVIDARSGREALELWERHEDEIQLLLTDLVMPDGVPGLELAEQLLQRKPHLKIIYTSGYSPDVAGRNHSLRDGVNFLPKPFDPAKLVQTVREVLDQTGDTQIIRRPGAMPAAN